MNLFQAQNSRYLLNFLYIMSETSVLTAIWQFLPP
jgi:hypothetical protein